MLFVALLLSSICLPTAAPQEGAGFLEQAQSLREAEAWQKLIDLAELQISLAADQHAAGLKPAVEAEATAGQPQLAWAFKSIGQAGLKQFPASVTTLKGLQDSGVVLDDPLPGLGSPLVEVVNTIYAHCWANFDGAFNRQCWGPLFEEFPDSQYAPIAAGRLLMAALKLDDSAEVKRLEQFFEAGLEAARKAKDTEQETDLTKRYVDGYLNAGVSNARVFELAIVVWNGSWNAAKKAHGFDGPVTGGALSVEQLQARRECELDTDHAYNTICRAFDLSGLELERGNPLYEMESEPSVTFEDVTAEVGLTDLRQTRVAAADFDRDGDPDLCFGGRLFLNHKGKFTEVSKERGLTRRGAGALFGDYDGDGNLDVIIASSPKSFLYRNLGKRGKFNFEEVSEASGVSAVTLDATPEAVAWVDFDDDGDLDLYFAVYEKGGGGHPDVLLENLGDGTFADASASTGVGTMGPYCGRGVSPIDVDLDGDSEIFVSNYRLEQNLFWQLDGDQLKDGSEFLGIKGVLQPADGHYYGHTIGSCWGDVDNDGDLDLFSANLAHPRFVRQGFSNQSLLGMQQADGTFTDEALIRGIRFQETHSDPAFVDIDNDGDLDLSLTCVYEGVTSALFQNDGTGHFTPITFRAGAATFHGWGQSWLDIDGDGFLDVIYGSSNGVKVLRNSGNDNHYIRLKLASKGKDPNAFGATVRVETIEAETPQTWMRQLSNARGTASQDEPILHFGLGSYQGRVKVSVTWPDSDRTESKTPKADRVFTVKQSRKAR
jgi:ASPIC/UnbV protein/VCBS repeat protein